MHDRIDELTSIARARMDAAAHHPNMVYAEIMFMTPDELKEFHDLRLKLPSPGQERVEAMQRLQIKLAKRRNDG